MSSEQNHGQDRNEELDKIQSDDDQNPSLLGHFNTGSHHKDSFVGSLSYYLLTGRKGAKLYHGNDGIVVICDHPHIPDCLLVFPEIRGNGTLTAKVLSTLHFPKNGVKLARYTEKDYQRLQSAFKDLSLDNQFIVDMTDEKIMDWEYPAHILDTKTTGNMTGRSFEKIRNKFNKVKNRLRIEPLSAPNAINAMRSSLLFWLGNMVYDGKETGHDLQGFYITLFELIKRHPDYFDGFVVFDGDEPAGFTIWDKAANGTVNAIAGLSRKSIKGMSEFQTITACRILHEQGIERYNLGGSETQNLDDFKRKFLPVESIEQSSYDVQKNTRFEDDFMVIDLPRYGAEEATPEFRI